MLRILLSKRAKDFLKSISKKHAKQITDKIEKLANDINSVPTIKIKGANKLHRAKSGEYRIIFKIENNTLILEVVSIGKRNDDEVYKNLDYLDN